MVKEEDKNALTGDLRDLWEDIDETGNNIDQGIKEVETEVGTLENKVSNLPTFVEQTHAEFEKYTSLTGGDMGFLLLAVALQSLRQILLNLFKTRIDDKKAAQKVKGDDKEHSDRTETRYYASIEEIIKNPVPFDCVQKEPVVKRNHNPKLSGFNHRYKALGHDPYLGLIIGTANIMTSTITVTESGFNLTSYHVHTGTNLSKTGSPYSIDKLSAKADTSLIFEKIFKRLQEEGKEGYKALALALWKECVHLRSDIRTKKSLPLPLLSAASPNLTRILGFLEIDYLTVKIVEKEYILSVLIDLFIRIIYGFCYDEGKDISKEFYKVRLSKILKYSNEIALTSSAIQTYVRIVSGDITSTKSFDFGGMINTLYRTFTTPVEIAKIQQDYLISKGIKYLNN